MVTSRNDSTDVKLIIQLSVINWVTQEKWYCVCTHEKSVANMETR